MNENTLAETDETMVRPQGQLLPSAKRALVMLLRYGVILYQQKPKIFEVVSEHQKVLGSVLADLSLKLLIEPLAGVAFIAQVDESDEVLDDAQTERVSVMHNRVLSVYDTLLLLVIRKHYQERERAGEQRIVIDVERLEAHLTPFLPLTHSKTLDRKRLHGRLQKMIERRLLLRVRGSEDRFEISPVIRYVVNAACLQNLLKEYERLAQMGCQPESDAAKQPVQEPEEQTNE